MVFPNRTMTNALRIFCAMLFLSLGFAHRPVQALLPGEAFSEAYRLPDGSFADICADHGERGAHDPHRDEGLRLTCEACLLAASIILPPPAEGLGVPLQQAFLLNPLRVESLRVGFTALARPSSRAPPLPI
nr:hypothetical protein REQ54_01485 [Rhizobium sp. Q54]